MRKRSYSTIRIESDGAATRGGRVELRDQCGQSMRSTDLLIRSIVAILAMTTALVALADTQPFGARDRLPPISLEDQHDQTRAIGPSTRIILFSRDMDGGKLLRTALEGAPEGHLASRNVVYVSDISGMPSLVATMFAVPSMRGRPYPMLLDRTGEATARLPDVEGKATLIFLSDLEIERVEHADDAEEVRVLLGLETTSPDAE